MTEKDIADMQKLNAETQKLVAEAARINFAEIQKLQADTLKIKKETLWHGWPVILSAITGMLGIIYTILKGAGLIQ